MDGRVVSLDDVIPRLPSCRLELLKIDAQGFDLGVVKSAGKWLQVVDWVKLEAPAEGAKPLYKGASTREDIIQYMKEQNLFTWLPLACRILKHLNCGPTSSGI